MLYTVFLIFFMEVLGNSVYEINKLSQVTSVGLEKYNALFK